MVACWVIHARARCHTFSPRRRKTLIFLIEQNEIILWPISHRDSQISHLRNIYNRIFLLLMNRSWTSNFEGALKLLAPSPFIAWRPFKINCVLCFHSFSANEETNKKKPSKCLSNTWKWLEEMKHPARRQNSGNHTWDPLKVRLNVPVQSTKILHILIHPSIHWNEITFSDLNLSSTKFRLRWYSCPRNTKGSSNMAAIEQLQWAPILIQKHLWWTINCLRKNHWRWLSLSSSSSWYIRLFTKANLLSPL